MGSDWGQWQQLQRKSKQFLVKFLGLALLVGLSFRLLFSGSPVFSPASELPSESVAERSDSTEGVSEEAYKVPSSTDNASIPVSEAVTEDQMSKDKCDLFTGEWIPDPTEPTYTNQSCRFIESPQNCMMNGRPDTGYLFWRWKPHGCDVPPFSAKKFLGGMQNKCLALIGDSIFRNHAQSLLCLLSKVNFRVCHKLQTSIFYSLTSIVKFLYNSVRQHTCKTI
ncbi:protein trichome birefringence-like 25 [Curcuma longa]|uniref:protein trichome birefringence-like 25 n=1 Tax=Curcuma longa TaxID=136217 RepID=UPI003D9ED85C